MSGAQVRIPLDSSVVRVPVGQVYVLPERCKGCRFCIEFCPEKVLEESAGMNAKGYHFPVVAAGKEIVWVVGHQIADQFKVIPATKEVLRLEALPGGPFLGKTLYKGFFPRPLS